MAHVPQHLLAPTLFCLSGRSGSGGCYPVFFFFLFLAFAKLTVPCDFCFLLGWKESPEWRVKVIFLSYATVYHMNGEL